VGGEVKKRKKGNAKVKIGAGVTKHGFLLEQQL